MSMDISPMQLPGSDYDFNDVTDIFRDAAAGMDPTDMFFMEGYGLFEAMSAIEIGEPRLDTGLIEDNENHIPFEPTTPMLPEEICWILDRACAYEMEWHTGRVLSHTVLTLIYIHELPSLEPDFSPCLFPQTRDPLRPIELVTVVLRSAIHGLLKCCDLSWRELLTGDMLDAEDWQSDKCEVSLLEGVPPKAVISRLEEAASWISRSNKVPENWRQPLGARILLRKSLLQLFECQIGTDPARFMGLIEEVRRWLAHVQSFPVPDLTSDSPARRAFDPLIVHRLSTAVPASPGVEPDVERAWNTLAGLLDDLHDLYLLTPTLSFTSWECMGNLRAWTAGHRRHLPYARSLTQKIFYNGVLVLRYFPLKWLVDRFFLESLGVPYESISRNVNERWGQTNSPPIQNLERILFKLLGPHIKNHWSNPPRRRRHFMKSLVTWHQLYGLLLEIVDGLKTSEMPMGNILNHLPTVALRWRLSVIQEVIFSGFQLELYSPEEIPFAYWYATQVIEIQLDCLDNLLLVLPTSSLAHQEYEFQRGFLTALQHIAMALLFTTMPMMSCDWDAIRPTFYRRYKWAYKPEYDTVEAFQVPLPSLYQFIQICNEVVSMETLDVTPANLIQLAKLILNEIIHANSFDGWAGSWKKDRAQFVQTMLVACERLEGLPASSDEMDAFNIGLLKWDPAINPWFPSLVEEGCDRRKKSYSRHLSIP